MKGASMADSSTGMQKAALIRERDALFRESVLISEDLSGTRCGSHQAQLRVDLLRVENRLAVIGRELETLS